MANIKVCSKCGKIGLDQYDFGIRWQSSEGKYYYRPRCKDCKKEYGKQYRQTNLEYFKEYMEQYMKQYRKENRGCYNEYQKQWKKDNPDKMKESRRKQYALRKGAEGSHSIEDLKYIYDHQQGKCPRCKKYIPFDDMTVDHITPLSWEGSTNYASNIQLLCKSCNSAKGNRNDKDYRDYVPLFLN